MLPVDAFISFLPVRDLDRTDAFYHGRLGLRLALDQGRCRVYEISRTAYLGFCQSEELPSGGRIILTFVTEDPDAWHDRLTRAGLHPEPICEDDPSRIRHFFVHDPDGYLVEFQRFWDEDWRLGGQFGGPSPRLA